jgi:hypothetical protein
LHDNFIYILLTENAGTAVSSTCNFNNILQSISNEEEGHIEQAEKLFKIIEKDVPQ